MTWERYGLEVVDAVFVELGVLSERPPADPESYAWATVIEGEVRVASFVLERGVAGMRADDLEYLARRLGLNSGEVFRRVRAGGGEIL